MSDRDRPNADTSHLPLPDQDSEEYWRAASERRLIARHDAAGRPYHYPRHRVPGTLEAATGWTELSGLGTVYSFTIVHQAASRAFRERVPYVVALVDLDEGPRVLTNIETDPAGVRIGQRVRVAWREEHDVVLPVFEPEPES